MRGRVTGNEVIGPVGHHKYFGFLVSEPVVMAGFQVEKWDSLLYILTESLS